MIAGRERYELVEDVAERIGAAPSTVREWCRRCEFPHVRLPGKRRVLLPARWTDAYLAGDVDLEVVHQQGGGRIVRPRGGR